MHISNASFKSEFTNQIITHHPIRYSTTRTEKSQLKPINYLQKTYKQNLVENLFLEKQDELTSSMKTNTHL